ncbi:MULTISPECIES: BlaI/MecI/CopY family transcriptional regulator [Paenibacillus]|uniref:BlaI/MecI/CopY family transcriptional regulator n=1 Tax=Paenibacillus TaxID=44249 RepID=UPI0022B91234|nr:BlaI/MecI/CopY family transcriptional regulator [Paenibacillus caseinilyticus]MCZ8522088.1 BlaI/MecI/CopY family transcriptional regulator [Paenibacillus caseinilyticus]
MRIGKPGYHQRGLERFFGPLEAKIMEILWAHPHQSIKDVQIRLEKEKDLNYNTVMTVMNRLLEKGVLTKTMAGRTSMYSPVESKAGFLENQSKEISHNLVEDFGPLVVNHMLDALDDADPQLLAKLEQKIKELKEGK